MCEECGVQPLYCGMRFKGCDCWTLGLAACLGYTDMVFNIAYVELGRFCQVRDCCNRLFGACALSVKRDLSRSGTLPKTNCTLSTLTLKLGRRLSCCSPSCLDTMLAQRRAIRLTRDAHAVIGRTASRHLPGHHHALCLQSGRAHGCVILKEAEGTLAFVALCIIY